MNISGFLQRQLATKPDYAPRESLVNKARSAELSKPLIGAGVGAVVGGTAGFLWGAHNLSKDQVSIATSTQEITRPVLVGADYDDADSYTTTYTTTDSDGNSTTHTQWHYESEDWSPIIQRQNTGFQDVKKVFQHTSSFGPLTGAAVGAGVGAVVGALVTSLTRLVEDEPAGYRERPKLPETAEKQALAQNADKAPLIGTIAGAVVGTAAGAWVGSIAADRNQVLNQVYQQPVYENRSLGFIPSDSQTRDIPGRNYGDFRVMFQDLPENFKGSPRFSQGGEQIVRPVFTGRYQPVSTTTNSHWLTPAKGAIIGGGLGAVTGLAAGVAGGILMKIAAGEQAPSRY